MDRYEGDWWLDWWANSATNLGGIAVSAEIRSNQAGWDAHGHLINPGDREALVLLHDLDPVFTLRFPDGSTIPVAVSLTDGRIILTEHVG